MRSLVHAELLKLRSTRTPAGLLFATLALVALTVVMSVPKVGDKDALQPLDDPALLVGTVGVSLAIPLVLVALLGEIACTQEFRYNTVTLTYLGEPRRSRILLAKLLAVSLSSLVVTVATLVLSVPLSIGLIRSREGEVVLGADFWKLAAAGPVVMALYGVIGVAVGALVRNQIAAIVGVLVWMLAVEQVLIQAFPAVGRWMPGGATDTLLQLGPAIGLDGKLLPAPISWLLLVGYAAAAVALALRHAPRRDVL